MAANDERRIALVDVDSKGVPSIQSLNEVIRQLAESIYKIEGRVGEITLRDDLSLPGKVTLSARVDTKAEANPPDVSAAGTGNVYFDSSTQKFKGSETGAAFSDLFPVAYGKWEATAVVAGTGLWTLDTEVYGNTTYFNRISTNTQIQIRKAGIYLVSTVMRVSALGAVGTSGNVILHQNGNIICHGLGGADAGGDATVSLTTVILAVAGDTVDVSAATGTRFGGTGHFNVLTIARIAGSS